jgi:FkbM family methyltransferase
MRLPNRLLGTRRWRKASYSQCGEDLIADFVLESLGVPVPIYLDIGANHPVYLSNTYKFYEKGGWGVCVEPDPGLCAEIRKHRPRDICLNVGVGVDERDSADFYVFATKTLSTFVKEEAERYQSYGNERIQEIRHVPLVPVNDILRRNFRQVPSFVSLDAEGIDLDILRAFEFAHFRPQVFCVETLSYTENKSERKQTEIIDLMIAQGYWVYADTFINTIFVDREAWQERE